MRRLIPLLFLLSCNNGTALLQPCGLPCWTGKKASRGVGNCSDGTWVCPEEGTKYCEGQTWPDWEKCDGVDNDCDGLTDEMTRAPYFGPYLSFACNTRGVCAGVKIDCEDGEYVCVYPDAVEWAGETSCDGVDNDCDGRIDEGITDGYCYTGPIGTENQAPCHPGVWSCSNGSMVCANQYTPGPELCDGVDNNCDGIKDNLEDFNGGYDLVFVLDTSGSMQPYINAVVASIDAYLSSFLGDDTFRFALVLMNHPAMDHVSLLLDFTDIQTFRDLLVQIRANGAGSENSVGAIYRVCDRTFNPLALSWRSDSVGVLFELTDESAQDFTGLQVQDVIEMCLGHSVLPIVWGRYVDDLKTIAEGAGGVFFELSTSWEVIHNDMQSVVVKLCAD